MVELKSVCHFIIDGDWIESKDQSSQGIRLVQTGNIGIGEYLDKSSRAKYISNETFMRLNCTEIIPGDILISRLPDPVGRACVVPQYVGRAITAVDCTIVRLNTSLCDPKYFINYTQSERYANELSKFLAGTTRTRISRKNLKKIQIPLPPLDEQCKIAAVLDKVSDLIAKRHQQLTKLDELVKARFVEMFGGKDYPSHELISLIKDGAGLSYGIVQPGDDGTGDMGVLRPVDFVDGKINVTSIKYIDRTVGEAFKKTELAGNELLITVRGTTGITALTDNSFAGMNVTRGIAVIRYDYDKIDPLYLNSYLKMDESQRYIQEHTHGATLQQINLSDLRVQPILVPPREKQEQFAIFVKQTEKMKTAISSSLDKLETLKKALMQKYFK